VARLTIFVCSSFTKQIVDARQAVMENEDESIGNVVEYFG
jgi:hypothetical protein